MADCVLAGVDGEAADYGDLLSSDGDDDDTNHHHRSGPSTPQPQPQLLTYNTIEASFRAAFASSVDVVATHGRLPAPSAACVGAGGKEKKEKAKEKTKQMVRGSPPRRRHSRKKSDPILWMQDDDEKALGMGSFLQHTATVEARAPQGHERL